MYNQWFMDYVQDSFLKGSVVVALKTFVFVWIKLIKSALEVLVDVFMFGFSQAIAMLR